MFGAKGAGCETNVLECEYVSGARMRKVAAEPYHNP